MGDTTIVEKINAILEVIHIDDNGNIKIDARGNDITIVGDVAKVHILPDTGLT